MNKRRVTFIIAMVVLVFADLALSGTVQVDCTKPDQTLTQALQTAQLGDTIRVTGTCTETITITTDDVTIEGHNNAVVDGQGMKQNVITIDGARRVTIKQVTVQHGDNGIYAQRGASVILDGVTAQDNADDVLRSGKTQLTARNNKQAGVAVFSNASGTFLGAVTAEGNPAGDRVTKNVKE